MSDSSGITLNLTASVAEVVLDLPTAKNSFRASDVELLGSLLSEAVRQHARCVILRGAGKVFSAGWDISSIDTGSADPMAIITGTVEPFCRLLRELPVPTIAAVSGVALGFGLGLALCCDLCIADDDAMLGSPFRNIGMVPDSGAHYFFLNRLGYPLATELIYTGRLLNGGEAALLGLINRATPTGTVAAEAAKLAEHIAAGPTTAFRLSKEILLAGGDFETMMRLEARQQVKAFASADLQEGIAAFQQRRKPVFNGS